MAKSKHNHLLDTINEIIDDGRKKGFLHLYAEDNQFTGRKLRIKGRDLFHFGTTGYLGLGQDERLKEAAIEAIRKYGTQFPLSKTYVSYEIYKDLERGLYEMYNRPVVITKNSTLGHIAVIPSIVRDEDAVILDQQVHASVQNACELLKPRGIMVDVIRHNNMEMLEDKIIALKDKHRYIYYTVDGVYSMYGDVTPIGKLLQLMEKYPQLHLYVDDVHGMSWTGKHGSGWLMSQLGVLHKRAVLAGTLSKSFGANGGFVVFPNDELFNRVKIFGGPNTFSAQLDPASVAAALASIKIHLSDEIYELQDALAEKISYCNTLIKEANLPIVEENNCPVFFIAAGLPAIGYNLIDRLMNEGFFVNLALFPVVPVRNSGIRFTISSHNHMEDIEQLVDALKYHYPRALEAENRSENSIRKLFNIPLITNDAVAKTNDDFKVSKYNSISFVNKEVWDPLLAGEGTFDWEGLKFLEEVFSENEKPEDNWNFHYIIIKDKNQKPVLATFLTSGIFKDDMLSPPAVSAQIEKERLINPYYMTSKTLTMGSLFTEGKHLYIDRSRKDWKKAIILLLREIEHIQEEEKVDNVLLRDFEANDNEIRDLLINQGFVKVDMPNANVIEDFSWSTIDEYLENLSARNRRHVRYDAIKHEDKFEVTFKEHLTPEEADFHYQLYLNVKQNNYGINEFPKPGKITKVMSEHPKWEFMEIRLKPEFDHREKRLPVAVSWGYINGDVYIPLIVGLDYDYNFEFKVYKQFVYQVVKRAKALNAKKVYFGLSADTEKRKVGAVQIAKVAYLQAKDNFNLERLEMMSSMATSK